MKNEIEKLLSIIVITYNRAPILKVTLNNLMSSPLKHCQITVINNHSTDNTEQVCAEYADFANFSAVTNKFNIGGDGNIVRAYEYADAPYVWIMGDDDIYHLDDIDDLTKAIASGKYDVIQIGSTALESEWPFGGRSGHIKSLTAEGYNYLRLSSNVSASIVRVSDVRQHIIPAYQNIVNHYPHMPLLLHHYETDGMLYITKSRILEIVLGSEYYSNYDFIKWWTDTASLLKDKKSRRAFIRSQFLYDRPKVLAGCYMSHIKKGIPSRHTISKLWKAFGWRDRIMSIIVIPSYFYELRLKK